MYGKETVGYESDYQVLDLYYQEIGKISGANNTNEVMEISFTSYKSGSVSTNIGLAVTGSYEQDLVLASVEIEVGIELSKTRTWTKGETYGAKINVAPGSNYVLTGYVPAVKTCGRIKYRVYDLNYPDGWCTYTYKQLGREVYIPAENYIHVEANVL